MSRRAFARAGRGFFEVGIFHAKTEANVGTLWRTAKQLGASGCFTVGRRYDRQATDTCKTWLHVPVRNYADLDDLLRHLPMDCPLVGIEEGGIPLTSFCHPHRACYLLGAEDHGLPPGVAKRCHSIVTLESEGPHSYNVAVAGSIVLYDRLYGKQP